MNDITALHVLNDLDKILLIFVGIGACIGLYRGLIKEVVGTIGVVLAAIIANIISPYAMPHLGQMMDNATLAAIIVWIVIFFMCMFLMHRIAYLLGRIMRSIDLNWLNRLAGGLFGAIKFCLIAALAISVIEIACANVEGLKIQPYLEGSQCVPLIHQLVDVLMPWISQHILSPALEMLK